MNRYVLLYGTDESLLQTRSLVLGHMGHQVVAARTEHEVRQLSKQVPIALLILCHTLLPEERERATAIVKLRHREVKCLVLVNRFTLLEVPAGWAVVDAAEGPARLLTAVARLLHRPSAGPAVGTLDQRVERSSFGHALPAASAS